LTDLSERNPSSTFALQAGSVETRALRRFGLEVGAMFLLIALWPAFRQSAQPVIPLLVLGIALLATACVSPAILKVPHRLWTLLGRLLGRITAPILLGILFFCIIAPLGFLARLLGRDKLGLEFDRKAKSYRQPCAEAEPGKLENPF